MEISIETTIKATIEQVWSAWTTPDDITKWNFASEEWCCPDAMLDLTGGGKFKYRMQAKDGSMGFDFEGTFTSINENEGIEFALDDDRKVRISFLETGQGIRVTETFEAENKHSAEQQKQGWQSILDNFKKHVETK